MASNSGSKASGIQGGGSGGGVRRRRGAPKVLPDVVLGGVNPENGMVIGLPVTKSKSRKDLDIAKDDERPYNGLAPLFRRDCGPKFDDEDDWATSLVPVKEHADALPLTSKKRKRDSAKDEEGHPQDLAECREMYGQLDLSIHDGAWKDFDSVDWKKVRCLRDPPRMTESLKDESQQNEARQGETPSEEHGKAEGRPKQKRPRINNPSSASGALAGVTVRGHGGGSHIAALDESGRRQIEGSSKKAQGETREESGSQQAHNVAQNTSTSDTAERWSTAEQHAMCTIVPETQLTLEDVSTCVRELHGLLQRLHQGITKSTADVDITSVCMIVVRLQGLATSCGDARVNEFCLLLGKYCTPEVVRHIGNFNSVNVNVAELQSFTADVAPWFSVFGVAEPASVPVSMKVEMSDGRS